MAGIRQILHRSKAAQNIRRITRTMEMISTAKYKSYSNKRIAVVDYHNALAQIGYLFATAHEPIDHPLLKENKVGTQAIFAIGSSRGLCGPYNDRVYQLVDAHIRAAEKAGKKLDIHATEGRLLNAFHYHHITPLITYGDIDEVLVSGQLDEITNAFIDRYVEGIIERFSIVYMRYYSASSQRAQTLTILPLHELIEDLTTRTTIIWPWKLSFEDFYLSPPASETINDFAKMLVRSSIEACLMDAALSEHFARMIAMKNATENAEDMIKELTNEYNHARQTQITNELLDIVSGTGALE